MSEREFEQFRPDLEAAERRVAGEIDPGVRALVVAVLVVLLAASLALPHAGAARGVDVLQFDHKAVAEGIRLPSRVFVWFASVFGVLLSMLALVTRRWALAWASVAGTAIASVFGVLSIWTRQTRGALGPATTGSGPGVGLILGTLLCAALTFHWVRVVWSRTNVLLAAEQQRRIAAAAEEDRNPWGHGQAHPRSGPKPEPRSASTPQSGAGS
jgi:hypothetical protein